MGWKVINKKLNDYYLDQIGIDRWVPRQANSCETISKLDLLAERVKVCKNCALYQTRKKSVFARGNPFAKLMIIGEAPGFYEDQQGLPFVGNAGGLLKKMLLSISIADSDVYICNVIKCRPPANRDPSYEEILHCRKHLEAQIAIVKPKFILALGRFAGQFLTKKELPLIKLRQNLFKFNNIPFIVTYHPAYLLRQPAEKKKAYSDLLFLQRLLNSS